MKLEIDHETLRPLIEEVAAQVLERFGRISAERIAYTEAEAAELLGMARHQLRDRRLEGAIEAKRIGKAWYYTPQTLREFVRTAN